MIHTGDFCNSLFQFRLSLNQASEVVPSSSSPSAPNDFFSPLHCGNVSDPIRKAKMFIRASAVLPTFSTTLDYLTDNHYDHVANWPGTSTYMQGMLSRHMACTTSTQLAEQLLHSICNRMTPAIACIWTASWGAGFVLCLLAVLQLSYYPIAKHLMVSVFQCNDDTDDLVCTKCEPMDPLCKSEKHDGDGDQVDDQGILVNVTMEMPLTNPQAISAAWCADSNPSSAFPSSTYTLR